MGLGWLGSAGGMLYHAFKLSDKNKSNEECLRHAYFMHSFAGIMISPSLVLFHQFIPHALITASALIAGPIAASFLMPKGSLIRFGPALGTALIGLVGVGFTSICSSLLGFSSFGMSLHNIDLYGGVALFSIYNAYDTHMMISDYEKGDRNYVQHSVNYSLNALNIFIRLLEIMSKNSNETKPVLKDTDKNNAANDIDSDIDSDIDYDGNWD
jgi:FtsH-binding integral membrane protein